MCRRGAFKKTREKGGAPNLKGAPILSASPFFGSGPVPGPSPVRSGGPGGPGASGGSGPAVPAAPAGGCSPGPARPAAPGGQGAPASPPAPPAGHSEAKKNSKTVDKCFFGRKMCVKIEKKRETQETEEKIVSSTSLNQTKEKNPQCLARIHCQEVFGK